MLRFLCLMAASVTPVSLVLADVSAPPDCAAMLADEDTSLDDVVDAGCQLTAEQVSRLMDNPVGELVSVPVQYDRVTVKEPVFGTKQDIETINVIPTFPVRMGDWNLVNRVVLSFPKVPVDADAFQNTALRSDGSGLSLDGLPLIADPFGGSTSGFGDLTYVGLFTPKKAADFANGKLIWAAGPTFVAPTASEDILGQGKWQVGPAAAAAYLGEDWTLGIFPQHRWSVGGDDSRTAVSQTNIQYFVYRKLPDQWSIGASPIISVDWEADDGPTVNLPIGIGVNKTTFVGRIPTRFSLEASYYAIRSDNGLAPEWGLRFSVSPAIPAAFLR